MGNDDSTDAEEFCYRRGMHRACATKCDQGKTAWIVATLNGDEPHDIGHLRVEDAVDSERGIVHRKVQPFGDTRKCTAGEFRVERHRPAGEVMRVEVAQ